MTRLRTLVHAVTGLLLLVQGVAVAAAPVGLASKAPAGTAAVAVAPCHASAAQAADDDGARSCCDADCPSMAACALGHIAFAQSVALPSAPMPSVHGSALRLTAAAFTPQSLLRPPIALHS